MDSRLNLVLIGMPGAGKSTVGVLLAKVLARPFVDTDLLLQAAEGRRLHELIAAHGTAGFRALEERQVLAVQARGQVIATGGSVVYSEAAMAHLRAHGRIVWLQAPIELLEERLGNFSGRGVVIEPGQSLRSLAAEREPLYRRHADVAVGVGGLPHEAVVAAIVSALQRLD